MLVSFVDISAGMNQEPRGLDKITVNSKLLGALASLVETRTTRDRSSREAA
jgi:hypothetical protein